VSAGVHGSVGGGGDIRGLSDGALAWVLKGAKRAGLVLDQDAGSRIHGFEPDPLSPLVNVKKASKGFTDLIQTDRIGPDNIWQLSAAAIRRWRAPANEIPEGKYYRPATLKKVEKSLESYVGDSDTVGEIDLLTEHVVIAGDQLRKLAKRYYNDANKSFLIFEANRDLINDDDELFLGWKLRIPKLPTILSAADDSQIGAVETT